MKIKFFKKEKNFKKSSLHLNPGLFWKLSIFMIFLVAVFSSFFGYYFFMKINKESILLTGGTSGQVETVKDERIFRVLEYFSLRTQKSNQILNSPAPIIDPSL